MRASEHTKKLHQELRSIELTISYSDSSLLKSASILFWSDIIRVGVVWLYRKPVHGKHMVKISMV